MDWQYKSTAQGGTPGRRHVLAARTGAGRHQLPQRHGLPAWLLRRLRRLGRGGLRGLGVGRRCARRSRSWRCTLQPRLPAESATRSRRCSSTPASTRACPSTTTPGSTTARWTASRLEPARPSSRAPRHNSYRAFLHPVLDRPNLEVRLRVRGRPPSWSRLQRRRHRHECRVAGGAPQRAPSRGRPGREVAAGAYDSPQLLLRSGIGPARRLEDVGIRPVVDLPVGRNLLDHLLIGVAYDREAARALPCTPT